MEAWVLSFLVLVALALATEGHEHAAAAGSLSLFHTRPIEWRHSRTGPDPALRRTWRPNFTHLRAPLTHSLIAFNLVKMTPPGKAV